MCIGGGKFSPRVSEMVYNTLRYRWHDGYRGMI